MSWECFLRKTERYPEQRIRVGKYIILNELSRGISGVYWVGLCGSFWNPEVASPHDIDLAIHADDNGLNIFTTVVGNALRREFNLRVDICPISLASDIYGVQKVRKYLQYDCMTIYGVVPTL